MTTSPFISGNCNAYPPIMIALCEISYQDIKTIPHTVKDQLKLQVVWGPAELVSDLDVAYSLMFVAQNVGSNEYIVVIRGTNFDSWESWMKEDFAIGTTQPFNKLAPHAPSTALISQGTYNGMQDLLKLKDPSTKKDVVTFLQGLTNHNLYVTGHSLGGTLTPPMFAYLNDRLYGGGPVTNMALWSFAGLTAGNAGFNNYFNGLGTTDWPWRLHNTLDIAPWCWESQQSLQDIYKKNDLSWGWPEDDYIKHLFSEAAGIGYAQPKGDQALVGTFDPNFPDDDLWTAQALHQHHSTTYRKLVDGLYSKTS